jgi:host factor-I protein
MYNIFMPFHPSGPPNARHGKAAPPEDTHQEAQYLKSLGEKQRPVSLKLVSGETISGWIEYYDRNMVRVTRDGAPNLFIYKHEIMYIAEDAGKDRARK